MNHFKTIIFFFLLTFSGIAQENLILNGDFEEYSECPDDWTQIERCKHVTNPCLLTVSTSDYFNTCTQPGGPTIPGGLGGGFQYPRSGDGMVGFACLDNENLHYREYIQLSLSKPLECNRKYKFQGYFNLEEYYRHTIKNIGFYFSETELNEADYLYNIYFPQVTDTQSLISDTVGWVPVSFEFEANGTYKYLCIGHFLRDSIDSYIEVNLDGSSPDYATYLLVDDVSIVEVDSPTLEFPNVFTPNDDGVNDFFGPLEGINSIDKLQILNRWGNTIAEFSKPPFEWDGKSQEGRIVTEGVYFYRVFLKANCVEKKENYHGMIHLIR